MGTFHGARLLADADLAAGQRLADVAGNPRAGAAVRTGADGLVATIGQMGLLGALIVFAPRPLYVVHFASTAAWGLTPLADQQLAGLLMWVLAMIPYVGGGLWLAWSSLRAREPAL